MNAVGAAIVPTHLPIEVKMQQILYNPSPIGERLRFLRRSVYGVATVKIGWTIRLVAPRWRAFAGISCSSRSVLILKVQINLLLLVSFLSKYK